MRWFFCKKAFPHSGHTCERNVQLPSGWRLLCNISPCLATKLLPQNWQKCVFAFCCGGEVIWTTVACWTCCWFCCGCCWVTWTACCWITCCLICGCTCCGCADCVWIWICWCCCPWDGLWRIWLTTSPLDVMIWTGTGEEEDAPGVVTKVVPVGRLTVKYSFSLYKIEIIKNKTSRLTHSDLHLGRDDREWRQLKHTSHWWDSCRPNADEDEERDPHDY